jgi:CheY-like chemotaxis protein
MSHEIRTPMNAVLGFIELVLSNKDIPVVERNHLEYAKKSSVSLLQLINEIMDFSKLEKDQFILEHIPFSLLDVLTKIHSTASVLLEHKKNRVGLNRILPANIPRYIYGDPRKLEQVLLNLLGNAIKFTSRGEISYGIHPRKKGYLTFFVRDTGTGILPEHRQHIFQPFRQADEKISRKHGGTGLGLAISKRIIELMGGSIWFESEPNEGTSFNFKIPCKPAKETDLNILMNEQQNTARISGKKILIIEDSRINRIYLEAILTKDGYQVVSAEDGLEGLEVLQRNGPFDLVLMDMYMPNLDGVEATKRIRNLNSSSGIPILGFTAAGTTKERELLKSAGCDDVINKPVQKEDLTAAISQLIFGN